MSAICLCIRPSRWAWSATGGLLDDPSYFAVVLHHGPQQSRRRPTDNLLCEAAAKGRLHVWKHEATLAGGFIARLFLVVGLMLLLRRTGSVDPAAFALTFLVFFFAYLGVEMILVDRSLTGSREAV